MIRDCLQGSLHNVACRTAKGQIEGERLEGRSECVVAWSRGSTNEMLAKTYEARKSSKFELEGRLDFITTQKSSCHILVTL